MWKEYMEIEGILLYQCHDIFLHFLCYMPKSYTNYVRSSVSWCLHSFYLQFCSLQRVRITRFVRQYSLHSHSYLGAVGSMLNCTFAWFGTWGETSALESAWDRHVPCFRKEDEEWLGKGRWEGGPAWPRPIQERSYSHWSGCKDEGWEHLCSPQNCWATLCVDPD